MASIREPNPWPAFFRLSACALVGLGVSLFMIFRGQSIPGHNAIGPALTILLVSLSIAYNGKPRS